MRFRDYPRFAPEKLFNSFCVAFDSYKFPSTHNTLQPEMLGIFGQIGSEVGYEVSIEGFGDLDVMWRWNQTDSNVSFIELALEHETRGGNSPSSLGEVLREVAKLRHFKSRMKVIMYYPKTEKIEGHLKDRGRSICLTAASGPLRRLASAGPFRLQSLE